jgi:hypothetical protein
VNLLHLGRRGVPPKKYDRLQDITFDIVKSLYRRHAKWFGKARLSGESARLKFADAI